jgi:GIY-YIG catalytic domain
MQKYTIYALADPSTRHVRYVGSTRNVNKRFTAHVQAAKRGVNHPAYDWIRGMAPAVPLLIVLQELEISVKRKSPCPIEAAETKWMKRFERTILNRIDRTRGSYCNLVNNP